EFIDSFPPASLLSNHDSSFLTHDLAILVGIRVETRAKTSRNIDTFFDNHAPKPGACTNTGAGHQDRVAYRRVPLNFNAGRNDAAGDSSPCINPRKILLYGKREIRLHGLH